VRPDRRTMTAPGAAEVTVVNADSWLGRTAQLAALLSRANGGDVIPDPVGDPADPQRIVAVSGLPYWSQIFIRHCVALPWGMKTGSPPAVGGVRVGGG
jgi:hypothetical protein